MEEAIQDFEGPVETRIIGLRSGEVSEQTGFVMDKMPKESKESLPIMEACLPLLPLSPESTESRQF